MLNLNCWTRLKDYLWISALHSLEHHPRYPSLRHYHHLAQGCPTKQHFLQRNILSILAWPSDDSGSVLLHLQGIGHQQYSHASSCVSPPDVWCNLKQDFTVYRQYLYCTSCMTWKSDIIALLCKIMAEPTWFCSLRACGDCVVLPRMLFHFTLCMHIHSRSPHPLHPHLSPNLVPCKSEHNSLLHLVYFVDLPQQCSPGQYLHRNFLNWQRQS